MRPEEYKARIMRPEFRATPEMLDLVRRRTMPFLDSIGVTRPLSSVLAEVYVQGMRDAADATAAELAALKSENDWLHRQVGKFTSNA